MKILLICSVIFATSSLVVAQDCTSVTKQVSCVTCDTFMLCPYASSHPLFYACPSTARYCVDSNVANRNDDCLVTPGTGCDPVPDPFECTSTGFMPSSLDCSGFYYCRPIRDVNGTLTGIEANAARCVAPTPIFNPDAVNQCERQTTLNSNNCDAIVCPPSLAVSAITARVRNLRKHYHRCAGGNTVIYQCPENKDYDEALAGLPEPCSYSCTTLRQTYVDQNNGTIYYECLCVGPLTTCQPTVRSCQRFYIYSEELRRCILPMSAPLEIDLEDQGE